MSKAFDRFCLTSDVRMPWAVELSVLIGVGGCGWPMSSSAWWMGHAFCALWKAAPSSASDAAATTCRRRVLSTWIGPLFGGFCIGF